MPKSGHFDSNELLTLNPLGDYTAQTALMVEHIVPHLYLADGFESPRGPNGLVLLKTREAMEPLLVGVDDHVGTVLIAMEGAQADHAIAPGSPQRVALAHQVIGERQPLVNLI